MLAELMEAPARGKRVPRSGERSQDRPGRKLRRVLDQLDAGDVLMVDAARPASAIHSRPVEHARGDHR